MKVGVPKETLPGEHRVALVPDVLPKLKAAGIDVLVERGAGAAASYPDAMYEEAGATLVSGDEAWGLVDCVVKVQKPTVAEVGRLRAGQALVGLLSPLIDPGLMATLAEHGVTAISLDAIPRTLSRAQTMDVLSSQANIGGYKAVLVAAEAFGRYFPLLTTAAGTAKPANVLILGIGVAGLQAIGTARRLGAVVKAYDVRPETKEQAESLGAQFVVLKTTIDATGTGGYARELTAEEHAAQQAELNDVIAAMDVVITTAQVPGRKPPVLVTADAVHAMKPGSVILDMAASDLGGNCELSQPRRDGRLRERGSDPRPGEPPGDRADQRQPVLRPQPPGAPRPPRQGRRADPEPGGGDHRGRPHHPRREGRPAGDREAPRARPCRRRHPRMNELLVPLTIFVLAILVGFEVIAKVPATLHTPLMSGANSIHGIVLVGGMIIAAEATDPLGYVLAFVAIAFGGMNVVGGYVVTDRMLQMFKKKPAAPKAEAKP